VIPTIRRFVLACLLPAISCGETSTETNSNQQPLSCTGSSNLAMIWSTIEQGTFLNPSTLPTPGANWSNYSHPNWPLLSFLHPPDWAPTTLAGGQTVGVDLLRTDGGGFYRSLGSWDMTGITVTQWLEETIFSPRWLRPWSSRTIPSWWGRLR